MIDTKLQGKVVLITGANHGIGAATARAFASEGASVFINYLRLPPIGMVLENIAEDDTVPPGLSLYNLRRSLSADKVVEEMRALGASVEAFEADLSDVETIPLLFDRAEAVFGPVDILVNNADYCLADTFLLESVFSNTDTTPQDMLLLP